MKFTRQQIGDACRLYAPMVLNCPVDPVRLLWAMAGNESSFGANSIPRFEPGWYIGGRDYDNSPLQHTLVSVYGKGAAYSYGPWQLMFFNFILPMQLIDANLLDVAAKSTVKYLSYLIKHYSLTTLSEIGVCWNHGSPQTVISSPCAAYVKTLINNYVEPIPLQSRIITA